MCNELIIREGGYYKTRDGAIVGPMLKHNNPTYCFAAEVQLTDGSIEKWTWTYTGMFRLVPCNHDLVEEITKQKNPLSKPKENIHMSNKIFDSIVSSAKSLRETIRPYEKYIIMAAVVIAIDYFIFDGKISEKTREIFKKLSGKLMSTLDRVIDKLGE